MFFNLYPTQRGSIFESQWWWSSQRTSYPIYPRVANITGGQMFASFSFQAYLWSGNESTVVRCPGWFYEGSRDICPTVLCACLIIRRRRGTPWVDCSGRKWRGCLVGTDLQDNKTKPLHMAPSSRNHSERKRGRRNPTGTILRGLKGPLFRTSVTFPVRVIYDKSLVAFMMILLPVPFLYHCPRVWKWITQQHESVCKSVVYQRNLMNWSLRASRLAFFSLLETSTVWCCIVDCRHV